MAQELAPLSGTHTSISLLDDKLLLAAERGESGAQMQKKYGINAAEAVIRVKKLLESQDVWTLVERKKLIINSMMRLKAEFDKYLTEIPHNKTMAGYYIRLLESISTRLDKETQFTDAEIEKVSNAQKRVIIGAVESGYDRARKYVADYYPDVDLSGMDAEFRVGLQEGFMEVD